VTLEAAAKDLEEKVELMRVVRTVDHGEGPESERGGDLAGAVAVRAAPLHGDDGGRLAQAGEEFE